jgi:hypothetical protein
MYIFQSNCCYRFFNFSFQLQVKIIAFAVGSNGGYKYEVLAAI